MTRILALAVAAAFAAGGAIAQDEPTPAERAHQTRIALMSNFAYNLGPLGAMAKGEMEYDAERAAMLAGNIATLAQVDLTPYWVEGSSSMDLEDSRALPVIWDNLDEVARHRQELVQAAQALQGAAPEGQEAFAEAFRAVGQACGGCHEEYREPND